MASVLEQAGSLKQQLLDFVLEAEGDLAIAFESFCAERLARFAKFQQPGREQTNLVIDTFLSLARIDGATPLQLFLEETPDLTHEQQAIVQSWQQSFTGLFIVQQVLPDGFELMNWLTSKQYVVKPNGLQSAEHLARLQPGEIILTRIAPVDANCWMFSPGLILLGKLGKPKLAVAIGNFKQACKEDLYGDAPELLEAAWQSVEQYHQEFVDFFGGTELTLSGYQADQKLKAFQEKVAQEKFKAAGINSSTSLEDLAQQAGVSEELAIATESINTELKTTSDQTGQTSKLPAMAVPQVALPDRLKKAESLAIFTHPRWGQIFLPTYPKLEQFLKSDAQPSEQDTADAQKIALQALQDPDFNTYIWKHLAKLYPTPLESLLQAALEKPAFRLDQDLEPLLQDFGKSLEPELPESASVPLHLHTLFQEALQEVQKSQSKRKPKAKSAKGFQ
jgi:hypothetical protein